MEYYQIVHDKYERYQGESSGDITETSCQFEADINGEIVPHVVRMQANVSILSPCNHFQKVRWDH